MPQIVVLLRSGATSASQQAARIAAAILEEQKVLQDVGPLNTQGSGDQSGVPLF